MNSTRFIAKSSFLRSRHELFAGRHLYRLCLAHNFDGSFSAAALSRFERYEKRFSTTSSTTNSDPGKSQSQTKMTNNGRLFVSQLKGPIVNQLWTRREQAKEAARNQTIDMERPRPPSESITNISYAFSTDEFLKEQYRNPFGQMRFGKVLEDLDALAGNIAFAHVQDPDLTIVTASVDRIRLSAPPNLDGDQHLSGKVTFVGTSSMEIRMQCKNEDHGEDPWMEGRLESC
jgi:acyl-CoA hydrolase